jgi:Domain of unknown function (DUF4340)
MKNILKKCQNISFSNTVIFIFILTVCVSSFFSELYQNPKNLNKGVIVGSSLPFHNTLEATKKISLKNRLGEFQFERNELGWKLISPRQLPAKEDSLNNIFSFIKEIKVKNAFKLDSLGESSFSLNSPFMEVSLVGNDNKIQTVKFGMIDSKNNTTYVGISGKDIIFQIESFQFPIEKLDLMDFVDPRIFYFSTDKISSIKIFEGEQNLPILSLIQKEGIWLGRNGQPLSQSKVELFFKDLNALKSEMILDQLSNELKEKINGPLQKPLFVVEVEDNGHNKHHFQVFSILNSIPDLKIDKKESLLVSVKDSQQQYLLSRKFLDVFRKKEGSL